MSAIGEAMQSVVTNGQNSGGFTLWDPVSQTGSGLIGQLFAGMNARRQWKYQQKAMALQQKYALEQMQKQSDLNQALWQYQFDAQNKYNDPTAVFGRYGKAGVTPAAVLGSSGVGVNATMPGGSGSAASGASGPSAAGLSGAVGPTPSMDALANMQAARSTIARNNAAANRDQAEADITNARNFGKEHFFAAFTLSNQLMDAGVKEKSAQAGYVSALQTWQEARNRYADLIAANDWLKSVGECAQIAEEYRRLRSLNDAEIPLMDQAAAANIAYIQALTGNLRADSRMTNLQADDFQQWFDVNWNTPIDVDEVDEDGKVRGKKTMTGREIAAYLIGLDYTSGRQRAAGESFMNWQRKHPMLMSVVERVAGGVAAGAAMRLGSRGSVRGTRTSYEEFYGPDGVQKGVKIGRYENVPLKY